MADEIIPVPKTLTEIMVETRDLIADPKHWICGYWQYKAEPSEEIAFCLEGALAVAMGIELYEHEREDWWNENVIEEELRKLQESHEYKFIQQQIWKREGFRGSSLNSFNDSHTNGKSAALKDSHTDIMETMDKVILAAKEYDNDATQQPFE